MKWRLSKEQTEQLMKAGFEVKVSELPAYQEVLDFHPYEFKDGKYIIYENPSISDLWRVIPQFIAPNGNFYIFDIDKKGNKWKAMYDGGANNVIFSSEERDEEIDALFDTYMFLLPFQNDKAEEPEDEIESGDDYFFTGKA